ncbi:MAG: adenosine-specific kinase [Candidatus Omnitrophica bacterium]|jgi:hypothetical protein|nr:adenosine-specific kinase [Candidatus Omnitrophota bacterium]
MELKFKVVKIQNPQGLNFILGQSHFIKTVEDIYEAVVNSVPDVKFALAFCEASGAAKVRVEGNDEQLKKLAADNALELAAGHSFIIFLKQAYPINLLNALKSVPEVCTIYCASANPVEVIIGQTALGSGILGVIDGVSCKEVEQSVDVAWRKELLRKIGYKL